MPTATEISREISTRLSPKLYEQVAKLAAANERSLAAEVRVAVRQYVDRHSEKAAA